MADMFLMKKNEGRLEAMIDGRVLGHCKAEVIYKLVETVERSERTNNGQNI